LVADASLAADLAALAQWDAPALSNAVDRLGVRARNSGFTDGSVRQLAGSRMCGVAVTAQLRAREAGEDAVPVADLYRAVIDAPAPAVVVVQDLDDPPGGGAFLGEVVGTLLAALGVAGFVTDGSVRDIDEVRAAGLTVHAGGLCVARSYVRLCAINVPVRIAGLEIVAGDILHGDQHGILQIPAAIRQELPGLAAAITAGEQDTIAWARSAKFSHESLLARKPPSP
jgi:regulator of RNase E activity RraA